MTGPEAPCSAFLNRAICAAPNELTILHLRRDLQVPTILRTEDENHEGYAEGKVTNTRFGSFPHSTLIGSPWGSQIRASAVDTGSRGRQSHPRKKRKREDDSSSLNEPNRGNSSKATIASDSGFVHVLPPTPENWTLSLPHRTQVVYTGDYSYITQRLRLRPGCRIIEAGAGSGSFTHAAARAVNGSGGKVFSFEFHKQRYEKLEQEIRDHHLSGLVELRHQDVCGEGFATCGATVNAVFLDLPAPWLALKHLTRAGPLDPRSAVRICTFSPCIEQVQRTVIELRDHGWLDVETVELAAKKVEVRRERVGLQEEGLRGVTATAASVDEAVEKLRDIERRNQGSHAETWISKEDRLAGLRELQAGRRLYCEGNLVHRSELELKTHTSYLVFATLPMDWTDEDEKRAEEANIKEVGKQKSKKQLKKEHRSLSQHEHVDLAGFAANTQ